jgi:hypothetical protein
MTSSIIVNPDGTVTTREWTQEEIAAAAAQHEATKVEMAIFEIQNQIRSLEATVTPRRLRDAILGTDNGWLANVETQIDALRAQLN